MAAWLDGVLFTPTLGGTTDWIVSAAVIGYNTPALAGAVNGTKYKYHAQSADLSQWEDGEGTYTVSTTTLTRTTILFSTNANAKVTFTTVPTVSIVALKEDMISVEEANSFSSTQKSQIATNIGMAYGQIPGEPSNGSASAGNIGEYVSSTVVFGSAISLTTVTAANVTSISLPAGDWDVQVNPVIFGNSATTILYMQTSSNSTSASIDSASKTDVYMAGVTYFGSVNGSTTGFSMLGPKKRYSLSTTTTVFMVVFANFSTSTLSAFGTISARRVR